MKELTISKSLLSYCFDVLINHLKKLPEPAFPSDVENESYPLFVTWKIGKNEDLRGCIGTFHP